MMWILIALLTMSAFIAGMVYLVIRIKKLKFIKKFENNKILKNLIPIGILLAFIALLKCLFSVVNVVVIMLHYIGFLAIFDLVFFIIKKRFKKEFKYYYSGIITLIAVPIYLCCGWYYAHHVYETDYSYTSAKLNNNLRIVQITDSHLGATFNSEKFKEHLKKIEEVNPDVILITGDFVDDGTNRDDMINSCKYLGEVKTKYGIYFSYGNHDKGYYGSSRGFSKDDLEEELKKNNVVVLQDEVQLINNEFYIVGRKDASDKARMPVEELTDNLDKNKYIVVMDHQPTDYKKESKAQVDLVLSGHTHGGQLLPINFLNKLFSENCRVYGEEKRNNTNFIVSSGISDWDLKFKTGCISEYVVIDVNMKK